MTVTYRGQTFTDKVLASVVEPNLWVNNSNDDNHDVLSIASPDVGFVDDKYDHMLKDQKPGFEFWYCELGDNRLQSDGHPYQELINLAPLTLTVPEQLRNRHWKPFLKITKTTGKVQMLRVYPRPATQPMTPEEHDKHRLDYLKGDMTQTTQPDAQLQLAASGVDIPTTPGSIREITDVREDIKELLFKAVGNGPNTGESVVTLALLMREPGTQHDIPADSVVITLRDLSAYWSLWSCRYAGTAGSYAIPVDDRMENLDLFPQAHLVQGHESVHANRKQVWVHVHGYDCNEAVVEQGSNEIFRRWFWSGFRGHLVAFMWRSDEGILSWPAREFDCNVFNAMQTAPRLQEFLSGKDLVTGQDLPKSALSMAGNDPAKLNVSAHSLGNLVMFEAMRLHERWHPGPPPTPLIKNAVSIEAATWSETFEPRSNVQYLENDAEFTAFRARDVITYVPDQLMQQSWRYWFQQAGRAPITSVLKGGMLYQHFSEPDYALNYGMRMNDWLRPQALGWMIGHYTRELPFGNNRPRSLLGFGDGWNEHRIENMPALMWHREWPVLHSEWLRLPAGARNLREVVADDRIFPFNAQEDPAWQWPGGSPQEFSHGGFRNVPFPRMYYWYQQFLVGTPQNPRALPKGVDQ